MLGETIMLQLPTSIRDFVCPTDHNTELYTCWSEKLTNSPKSVQTDVPLICAHEYLDGTRNFADNDVR